MRDFRVTSVVLLCLATLLPAVPNPSSTSWLSLYAVTFLGTMILAFLTQSRATFFSTVCMSAAVLMGVMMGTYSVPFPWVSALASGAFLSAGILLLEEVERREGSRRWQPLEIVFTAVLVGVSTWSLLVLETLIVAGVGIAVLLAVQIARGARQRLIGHTSSRS